MKDTGDKIQKPGAEVKSDGNNGDVSQDQTGDKAISDIKSVPGPNNVDSIVTDTGNEIQKPGAEVKADVIKDEAGESAIVENKIATDSNKAVNNGVMDEDVVNDINDASKNKGLEETDQTPGMIDANSKGVDGIKNVSNAGNIALELKKVAKPSSAAELASENLRSGNPGLCPKQVKPEVKDDGVTEREVSKPTQPPSIDKGLNAIEREAKKEKAQV